MLWITKCFHRSRRMIVGTKPMLPPPLPGSSHKKVPATVSIGMGLSKASRFYHLDLTIGKALHNHLPERGVIKVPRLRHTSLCNLLWSRLRHDQCVDVLTLHSTPVLKRSRRNARHEEKQKERELGWVRLARATLDQRLQTTTAHPLCKHTYHDRPLKS